MARGTTASTLLSMLKTEIGDYAGANTTRDAALYVLLSNTQKSLALEHYWPFLERRWDVAVAANTQFVQLPTSSAGDEEVDSVSINFDKLPKVEVLFNSQYLPVLYGIAEEEYNTWDFKADGAVADPIRRWRLSGNPNETKNANDIEVWPVPATAQTLRFSGERALQTFATSTDKADLDDLLIVYFAAAHVLTKEKQANAPYKLQQAQRRLQLLRQGYEARRVRRTLDGEGDARFQETHKLVSIQVAVH